MIIIIDGYNLLRHLSKGAEVSERERDHFIARMGRYASAKSHRIIVVFDGGPGGVPSWDNVGNILVIYAGARESADSRIVRLAKEHRSKEVLVISSDREVRDRSTREGAITIGVSDFCDCVDRALTDEPMQAARDNGDMIKLGHGMVTSFDRLMQAGSDDMRPEEIGLSSDEARDRTGDPQRLSKRERELARILKKL